MRTSFDRVLGSRPVAGLCRICHQVDAVEKGSTTPYTTWRFTKMETAPDSSTLDSLWLI